MSTSHGLVIAAFGRGTARWITVWDIDRQEKFDMPASESLGEDIPDEVEIDRDVGQVTLRLPGGRTIQSRQ